MNRMKKHGFTLIELSIVLVIIGLIVGGVLAGRELIEQSKIRKIITQKERFATAANTFRSKYNCLPGDCASGTALGFSGGTDNNDGIIYGVGNNDSQFWFWQQMYEAGLITEHAQRVSAFTFAGDSTPTCDLCIRSTFTAYGPPYFNTGGWLVVDLDSPQLPYLQCAASGTSSYPIIPRWRALALTGGSFSGQQNDTMRMTHVMPIDTKIDDGKPFTGNVLAISAYLYSDGSCSGSNLEVALNAPGTFFSGNFYPMATYPESVVDVLMRAGF